MGTTDELAPLVADGRSGVITAGSSHASPRDASRRALAATDRLRVTFAPRSIALVGASEGSGWSRFIMESLTAGEFAGKLVMVHRSRPTAFGRPTIKSLRDLDEPVDLAFALVPTVAVESVIEDAAAAGVRSLVVLASGYGENGESGRAREERLVDLAIANDITILGPNCLGFINAPAHVVPFGLHIDRPLRPGPVGVVLQSGALASVVTGFMHKHGIGISVLASMGNEAVVTAADVIDYLIEDDKTKVITLFLETIRDPAGFKLLAEKALRVGKPIVVLKVGRTPAGQATALAHTGAIAGDDAVVDAVFRQTGVIRVGSLEELLTTAGLLGYTGPPSGSRMGVVTTSGGACDIIADRAYDEGIEVPDFAPDTVSRLGEVLPEFASIRNPLDQTGYLLADEAAATKGMGDVSLNAVADDPNVDFIFNAVALPAEAPEDDRPLRRRLETIAATQARTTKPLIHFTSTLVDVPRYAHGLLDEYGLHVLGGIEFGLMAVGSALRWSATRTRWMATASDPREASLSAPAVPDVQQLRDGAWSEEEGRQLLAKHQVPLVPARLVTSAAAAVGAAEELGYPVVLKVCSASLTHKSDIGGVALRLTNAAEVEAAYARVDAAGRAHADDVDGVLVAPMRPTGTELFVGITQDPAFGPVLAVGLGGVFVEVFSDVSLRVLPISTAEIVAMFRELRGVPLLEGARGTEPVDLEYVAAAVAGVVDAAMSLGPALQTVEVNPLWVSGAKAEALDVLVVSRGPAADMSAADR